MVANEPKPENISKWVLGHFKVSVSFAQFHLTHILNHCTDV